jgi:ribose-phosphate pyrophosphokinase
MVFALGPSAEFGRAVADEMGIGVAPHEERYFEDREFKVRPLVDVAGREVYVIDSLDGDATQSANDKLCRMLFFIAALKDAGARRVNAVAPYMCYARKDRRTKSRDPVTLRYVAQMFDAVGTDSVITMEAHNPAALENAFRCPSVRLSADELFARHFAQQLRTGPVAVVSPDIGGSKRAEAFRGLLETELGRPVAKGIMDKQRSGGVVSGELFAGDVEGHPVIIVEDLISTGTTMAKAAQACKAQPVTYKTGSAGICVACRATSGMSSPSHGRGGLWKSALPTKGRDTCAPDSGFGCNRRTRVGAEADLMSVDSPFPGTWLATARVTASV